MGRAANIVIEEAIERHTLDGKVADSPYGLFIIRGENVVLLGEMDDEREARMMASLERIEPEDMDALRAAKRDAALAKGRPAEEPWVMAD